MVVPMRAQYSSLGLPALIRRAGMTDDDITEVWRTRPYSHCAFTARPGLDDDTCSRFVDLLVAMDPADPDIAEMMRMEQLTKWVRAEDTGLARPDRCDQRRRPRGQALLNHATRCVIVPTHEEP